MAKLNEQNIWEIHRLYVEQEASVQDIAEHFDWSVSTIYAALRQTGVTFGTPGKKSVMDRMDADDIERLIDDYQTGVKLRILTERFNISVPAVYSLLRQLGIPPRTESKEYLEGQVAQYDEAVEMYKQGWALWFISEQTSVAQAVLYRELRIRGVPLRGSGVRGLQPVYDPKTREPMIGEDGQYVAEDHPTRRIRPPLETDEEEVAGQDRATSDSGSDSSGLGSVG